VLLAFLTRHIKLLSMAAGAHVWNMELF